ncbi:MAG: SH3 domain-containing protein [Mogibacterium sp.]|nr:SH3 domain-containing protein [Mogibacterium sp.]
MKSFRIVKTNPIVILLLFVLMLLIATASTYAASVPSARGHVNSSSGVILRKSSSTSSKKIATLQDNTEVTIYKEVFKKKTSTSKKYKWYYVSANGKKGYIRADLINDITYGSITGTVKSKVNYRKGAGTKMKRWGRIRKAIPLPCALLLTLSHQQRAPARNGIRSNPDPNTITFVQSTSSLQALPLVPMLRAHM